jgi:hypothetical protein
MRSRLAVYVLVTWSLWASAGAFAQHPPGTIPPPQIYAPSPYDASNLWPAWGVPAYDYPPPEGRYPYDAQYGSGPDGLITERLPQDRGFDYEDSPVDRYLAAAAKSIWIRVEYLDWKFDSPGSTLLGSQVAGVADPSRPFSATVAGSPATVRVPTTSGIQFPNVQGIRGSMGIPTSLGSLEANVMAFGRVDSRRFDQVEPANPLAPELQVQLATSTLLNNQPSNNLFLYDESFSLVQTTQMFGAEANWVGKSPYEYGLVVRPLVGFRYLTSDEELFQRGTFDQQGALSPPLVSEIDSFVENRVYAPQIGLRLEWVNSRFTLGVEPKIAFGVNSYDATVRTERLRSPGDPEVVTNEDGTRFAPIGDLSIYGKLHLRDNFALFLSYQWIVASGISRPADNIHYNDNGPSQPAGIVVDADFGHMVWQGLTVGGELRFR